MLIKQTKSLIFTTKISDKIISYFKKLAEEIYQKIYNQKDNNNQEIIELNEEQINLFKKFLEVEERRIIEYKNNNKKEFTYYGSKIKGIIFNQIYYHNNIYI